MGPPPTLGPLIPPPFSLRRSSPEVTALRARVRDTLLASSRHIDRPNFSRFGNDDLQIAFDAYDALFFDRALLGLLAGRLLTFRISTRASSRAGSTHRLRHRAPSPGVALERFEIRVSSTLLFGSFRDGDRAILLTGHPCADRTDALQRVMEHEIVHLIEMLVTGESRCAAAPFREIAARLFGHAVFTHDLVTPRERAAVEHGLRAGDRVTFSFEDATLVGLLNRVTKRATVLVEQPDGVPFSDGRRYRKYYVPLSLLSRAQAAELDSDGGGMPKGHGTGCTR